jgi:hypothetical protein
MFKAWMMTGSLVSCLTIGACNPGSFCEVVSARIEFAPETARAVVRTDRDDAQRIAVQNAYGQENCDWAL